ncbi:MAG: ribonucleotide reductase N-terminal alpha domain-containing protein [Gemmatimonadota bacterium]
MPDAVSPAETLPEDLGPAEMSENAKIVLGRRYLKKNEAGEPAEDPETMFWRVARTVAEEDRKHGASEGAVEQIAHEFYRLMTTRMFEPNSPTLMNAGRPLGQLSACFVLPVEDALSNGKDGIYDTLRAMALVHQSGGGTGFSFSRLRPSNDIVRSTMGVASGPVSFMSLYDQSTEVVKQGGTRRGANMGILRVDHPDIRGFIACKSDVTKITNFNISVAVTNAFMEALKKDEDYDLISPRNGAKIGRENAREIFDLIVEGAWSTGEPGVFFIDQANLHNPVPALGGYEATNPCVIGSTRLATDRGLLTVEELEREVMEIRVGTDDRVPALREAQSGGGTAVKTRTRHGVTARHAVPVFKSRENAEVFRLVTEHGYEITATDNHKFYTPDGAVELKDLEPGDTILLQSGEGPWGGDNALPEWAPTDKFKARMERGEAAPPTRWSRELGQLLGWVVADGWVSEELPEGRNVPNYSVGLLFGGDEKELEDGFRQRIREWTGLEGNRAERPGRVQLIYKSALYYFLRSLGVVTEDGRSSRVPTALWKAPEEAVIGFLQAAFTADGTVNRVDSARTCTVRLASSEPEFLREVQLLLLNMGMVANLRLRRKAGRKLMPDGHGGLKEYAHKAQYELILDKVNRDRFVSKVGFLSTAKQEKVESYLATKIRGSNSERFETRIRSISAAGREDVYCTTEPETHSIIVNGCVTVNCGEQPLIAYDVCNLGSINVGAFAVMDAPVDARPEERVDWDELKRVVHMATHFLDNVIDANNYPLPEIHDLAHRIRRIGLGLMGWADLLVRVGVPYDSDDAVSMARTLMGFIDEESRNASEKLAESRGAFPEWERSIWGPDATCARHPNGGRLRPGIKLRNCNLTTVAPTGTISIIADCAGGIEPLFAVAFMRNQAGVLMPDVNKDFVRIAREQGWYSEDLMRRIAEEGHIHFDEVPEEVRRVFVTAHDVTPEWHIRMQAAFQEHVDSAISKTCNFPEDATREEVREIYLQAYELECKGVTVYRDGSRPMQVLSTGKTAKEVSESDEAEAAERARMLQDLADARERIHQLEHEREHLESGLSEEQVRSQKRLLKRTRPAALRGITRKMISPLGDIYVTINEDETGKPFELFATLGKAGGAAMADVEAIGRLISLALRSGIGLTEVHQQLRGISCDRAVGYGPNKVLSVPDAIAQAIELYQQERAGVQQELPINQTVTTGAQSAAAQAHVDFGAYDPGETFIGTCPDCASELTFAEGCVKCMVCGYSECG